MMIKIVKNLSLVGVLLFALQPTGLTAGGPALTVKGLASGLLVAVKELQYNYGSMSIHDAARRGDVDAVAYLVKEKKIDVNKSDRAGNTALHFAAETNHLEVVKYLIEQAKAIVDATDKFDFTPLHRAAEKGHSDIITYLVEKAKAILNAKTIHGFTPLHFAAANGYLDIVKYLIKKDANITETDEYGFTPLHHAAANGYFDIVKYLVESGVNITALGNGKTSVDLAKKPEIKEYLTACTKFKSGTAQEIEKYVEGKLSVTEPELAKKNFEILCRVTLPDAKKPGVLYWIIKDNISEYNQKQFEFTFNTPIAFYQHMLELYKEAPSKLLLDFCRELFRLCKQPIRFGGPLDNESFEGQLAKALANIFAKVELKTNYSKIKQLYWKEYFFPANLKKLRDNQRFCDLKLELVKK